MVPSMATSTTITVCVAREESVALTSSLRVGGWSINGHGNGNGQIIGKTHNRLVCNVVQCAIDQITDSPYPLLLLLPHKSKF